MPSDVRLERAKSDLRVTLRILVVTDGAIDIWNTPTEPAGPPGANHGFTLREMARALWDAPPTAFPYTVFAIDHAIHGVGSPRQNVRLEVDPEGGEKRTWIQYENFCFVQPGFRLEIYDQVWLFGFWPGDRNGAIPSHRKPLSDAEINVLSKWMNAGGGVFATGGHGLLGQYLCGGVSRVRAMRRGFCRGSTDDAPRANLVGHVDTMVPVRTINGQPRFDDQSEEFSKPLYLKRSSLWDGLLLASEVPRQFKRAVTRWAPNPVMSNPLGPADVLSEHRRKGRVREDHEAALDFDDPIGAKEFPGGVSRPKPEVVAWSTVRGGTIGHEDRAMASVVRRIAPAVAAYDGERANVGRVVVDSTFHNWLDINVRGAGAGLRRDPQTGRFSRPTGMTGKNLELAHDYVRNIALWLAPSEQRDWMQYGRFVYLMADTAGARS